MTLLEDSMFSWLSEDIFKQNILVLLCRRHLDKRTLIIISRIVSSYVHQLPTLSEELKMTGDIVPKVLWISQEEAQRDCTHLGSRVNHR